MHVAIPPIPQYISMAWCSIREELRLHGVVLS